MLIATAPGLRDQRVRVYAPTDAFTDGYQSTTFHFVGEYWTRIEIATTREAAAGPPQQHLDFRTEAVASFDSYAVVPQNGLVRWGDIVYFVRGVLPTRMLNTQTVALELVSTDRFQSFVLVHTPASPVSDELPTVDPIPLTPGNAV